MKVLFALCTAICITGVYCDDVNSLPIQVPHGLIDQCAKKHSLSEATVKEITTNKSFSGTQHVQCFGACLMDHSGLVKDGKFNKEFENSAVGKECIKLDGDNECKMGADIMACLMKKDYVKMTE